MKKFTFFCLTLLCSYNSFAIEYFVSALLGKDTNTGLKKEEPFKTIQKAGNIANAGDTVFIMDGIYKNSDNEIGFFQSQILFVMNSGKPNAWITFQSLNGHNPILQIEKDFGIRIVSTDAFAENGALSYIRIKDLKIIGNANQVSLCDALNQTNSCNNPQGEINWSYNGHGISIGSEGFYADKGNVTHHIEVINCDVSLCSGSGIGAYRADYIKINNNEVYNNCWKTSSGSSGIHIYNPRNSNQKSTEDFHYTINNNTVYNNRNEVPFFDGKSCKGYTDGNGIIIDDSKNEQSNKELFLGNFLIENNIIYENGGSAINIFGSDNITITNNSTYKNAQFDVDKNLRGELVIIGPSNNIRISNNIFYARNKQIGFYKSRKSKNVVLQNNISFNARKNSVARKFLKQNPLFSSTIDSEKITVECKKNNVTFSIIPNAIKKNLSVSSNSPARKTKYGEKGIGAN